MAVQVEVEIEVARPCAEVFAYLADATNLPAWMPQFASVEQASSGAIGLGTTFRYRYVRPAIASELRWIEFDRDRRLAWDGPPVRPGAFAPSGSIQLEPVGTGTRVLGIYAREPGGPLMRLVAPLRLRAFERDRASDFERLKALLEVSASAPPPDVR